MKTVLIVGLVLTFTNVYAQVGGIYLSSTPDSGKPPKSTVGNSQFQFSVELKPSANLASLRYTGMAPGIQPLSSWGNGSLVAFEFKISPNFYIAPHVGFLNIHPALKTQPRFINDTTVRLQFDMSYAHLPLMLKYNIWEEGKFHIFSGAGLDVGLLTNARFSYAEEPSPTTFNAVSITNQSLFRPHFISLLLNLGFKFWLSDNVYALAEAMMNGGRNVLSDQVFGSLTANPAQNREFYAYQYYFMAGLGVRW